MLANNINIMKKCDIMKRLIIYKHTKHKSKIKYYILLYNQKITLLSI